MRKIKACEDNRWGKSFKPPDIAAKRTQKGEKYGKRNSQARVQNVRKHREGRNDSASRSF
jgi:hypothetical protein